MDHTNDIHEICQQRRIAWLTAILDYVHGKEEYGVQDVPCILGKNGLLKGQRSKRRGRKSDNKFFRTMIDSWFAYRNYEKPGYLKRTLSVQWFNRGDLANESNTDIRQAILSMHFHSRQALLVLEGEAPHESLAKDHAIPVKVLEAELRRCRPKSIWDVERFLDEHYKLGVITGREHEKLKKAKLGDRMPEGESHWLSRYRHRDVDVEGLENPALAPKGSGN